MIESNTRDLTFGCRCGAIRGLALNVSAKSGNHLVCHCGDCRAIVDYLNAQSMALDAHGGIELFQLPLNQLRITQGKRHLTCHQLKPGGLYRWSSRCCQTPLLNTLSPRMGFASILVCCLQPAPYLEQTLGPIRGYAFTKEQLPAERSQGSGLRLGLRIGWSVLRWSLQKRGKFNDFFDDQHQPICKPFVLSQLDPHP